MNQPFIHCTAQYIQVICKNSFAHQNKNHRKQNHTSTLRYIELQGCVVSWSNALDCHKCHPVPWVWVWPLGGVEAGRETSFCSSFQVNSCVQTCQCRSRLHGAHTTHRDRCACELIPCDKRRPWQLVVWTKTHTYCCMLNTTNSSRIIKTMIVAAPKWKKTKPTPMFEAWKSEGNP